MFSNNFKSIFDAIDFQAFIYKRSQNLLNIYVPFNV